MKSSARHRAPRVRAALLALSLAGSLTGCLGMGQPKWAGQVARPDPPPIPARKPTPPTTQSARLAPAPLQAQAVAPAVTRAPVATESLAPLRAPSAPARSPVTTVSYRVRPGDTVYGVARRFVVPLRAVIDANRLRPPYSLRVGQVLRVPNPRRHVVRPGDTVHGVSRRYGVDPSQLVRLNAIKPPFAIAPGQHLALPVATPGKTRAVARAGTQPAAVGAAPAARPGPGTTSIARRPTPIPQPPPRAGGKFLWPVLGRTIAGYGPKGDGRHNDGINIAAPRGAPVHAAENGVVAYIGNELRGFGNLILIKHAGGWVTAYAHNDGFLVRRGDTVKRGQAIARIGSSGSVATPQLHFEIRKGARSVDPMRLLGPQRAATAQPG
jgi:murein DD-endopeptidase MepM/ murein hydrolase activator NlpD